MKGEGMNALHRLTSNIKVQFNEKTHHPYVQSVIYHPSFNEDAAYILTACLLSKGLSEKEIQYKILATMLIQSALDTHDLVQNKEEDQPLIVKQLTVLAGDFYSGLYYKILADVNDVSFIRTLAEGTQEVNENKIRLLQKDYTEIEEFVDIIRKIESSIAQKVCDYVHASPWKSLVSNLLLFNRLLTEKRKWLQSQVSMVFDSFQRVLFTKETHQLTKAQERYVLDTFDRVLTHIQKLVEMGMRQITNIDKEVIDKIHSIIHVHEKVSISYVEEG